MKAPTLHNHCCPLCHKHYIERPALSQLDNQTLICPDCGTRQALTSLGIDEAEQEKILEAMHRCSQ